MHGPPPAQPGGPGPSPTPNGDVPPSPQGPMPNFPQQQGSYRGQMMPSQQSMAQRKNITIYFSLVFTFFHILTLLSDYFSIFHMDKKLQVRVYPN